MMLSASGFPITDVIVQNTRGRVVANNGMKIIYNRASIRKHIEEILAPSNGRRIAIAAFVGGDVMDFIPSPEELTVYCWPNVVATNPDGIRYLMNHGATVYFVDHLHMKVYWSERNGYLLGSPNLSKNALDTTVTGLHEIAVYNPDSSAFEINDLLHYLHDRADAKLVDSTLLKEFEKAYRPVTVNRKSIRDRIRQPEQLV
jgi:hypothetical protein